MKNTKTSLVSILLALLTGCASTESIVISNKAVAGNIEEGIVYSLPKQLVKVVYSRKEIDSTIAASTKQKAKEAVDSTAKAIKEKKKAEKELVQLIKNIDPQAANKSESEAKQNLKLTEIKAEKLGLTKTLATQTKKLKMATINYAKSLEFDEAFSEQLNITAETPIADTTNTFYAKVKHRRSSSDTLELKTKNGLLDGAIGHSEDKTGEIVVSLVRGISGLIRTALTGGIDLSLVSSIVGGDKPPAPDCQKASVISITQVIDPGNDSDDIEILNRRLEAGCIKLKVVPPRTAKICPANIKKE